MKKRKAVWLPALIAAVIGGIVLWPCGSPLVRLEFVEEDAAHLNPARGFYIPVKSNRPEQLEEARANGCSLVFIMYDIGDFRDRDLSGQKIEELETIFKKARGEGLKVVFRAAYGFDEASVYNDPKELALITRHIRQIKPVLQEYGDILYAVQAGFLGAYGEWHSSNFGDPPSADAQAAVLSELFDGLPKNVFICVRRPSFIRMLLAQGKLDQVYAGRIGVHNDALLGSADDYGTYTDWSREEELRWAAAYFRQLPYGGETCCLSGYAAARNAVSEFSMLHLSFLNSQYNLNVLNGWRSETVGGVNAYDYIGQHMGYRFSLQSAELSPSVKPGGDLKAVLHISNTGFASLCGDYRTSLVLKGQHTELSIPLEPDATGWPPDGNAELCAEFEIPEGTGDDALRIGLQIADGGGSLSGDDRYAVALQNSGMDFSGGVNFFAAYQKTEKGYQLIHDN